MKEKNLTITFVNVGYGEAILLECPDDSRPNGRFTALIDGGSAESAEFENSSTGRVPLETYLQSAGISHLDLAISTHIHEDHLCGLLRACTQTIPDTLWQILPPDFYKSLSPLDVSAAKTVSESKFLRALNDYQALCGLVEEHGGRILSPAVGSEWSLCPGLTLRVLAPSANKRETLAADMTALFCAADAPEEFLQKLDALDAGMNNYSFVLLLDYFGTKVLLPGDTNIIGYQGIDPADLRADLFKVGHHGQMDGADEALTQIIRPRAVVCCASSDRRYHSAHPDTMRMFSENGAQLYFSDCPPVPGLCIPPHQALRFTLGPGGALEGAYLPRI